MLVQVLRRSDPALLYLSSCYFMWGFVTIICNSLLPLFQEIFGLSFKQAALFPTIFFSARLLISFPTSWCMAKYGYRIVIDRTLWLCAFGAMSLSFAFVVENFWLTIIAFGLLSLGMSAIQVVAQPYVSLIGDESSAGVRQGVAAAGNSIGTTFAPLLLAAALTTVAMVSDNSSHAVALVFAMIAAGCGLLLAINKLPDIKQAAQQNFAAGCIAVMRMEKFALAALVLAICVGVEVAVGTYTIEYLVQLGEEPATAIRLISVYWCLMLVGRVIFAKYGTKFCSTKWQLTASFLAALFCLLAASMESYLGAGLLILCGLCNAAMYAIIYSKALIYAGSYTVQASAILIMAAIGGAILPLIQASAIDVVGVAQSMYVLTAAYVAIGLGSMRFLFNQD